MCNSDPTIDVSKIISKMMDEQVKSTDTNSSVFQLLLEEQNTEEILMTSILPIYEVLKHLRKEGKISTEEFNERIDSLEYILHLLQKLTDEN